MSLSLKLHEPPSGARLVAGSLADYADSGTAQQLEQAFEAGRQAGLEEARTGGVELLNAAVERCEAATREAEAAALRAALELATEITRGLLRAEIDKGVYELEPLVREMLAQGDAGYGTCTIRLHPEDAKRLEGASFRAGTTVEPDAELRRGDIQVLTPQGVLVRDLDACLQTIIGRIKEDHS